MDGKRDRYCPLGEYYKCQTSGPYVHNHERTILNKPLEAMWTSCMMERKISFLDCKHIEEEEEEEEEEHEEIRER